MDNLKLMDKFRLRLNWESKGIMVNFNVYLLMICIGKSMWIWNIVEQRNF